jgi:hypothetical protein
VEYEQIQPPYVPNLQDKSADVFIDALRQLDRDWREQLPEDAQIAIYVPMLNGRTMRLGYIRAQGFNVVYIQGNDAEGETYVLIAHQATLQFFCQVVKVTPEQPRRQIGFGPHLPAPPQSET